MPTLAAMRRRGYTADAIKDFLGRVGVAKADSMVEGGLLEALRARGPGRPLHRAPWPCCNPLKVDASKTGPRTRWTSWRWRYHPDHPEMGTRKLHFTRTCYIEREDFMEEPVKKFFRLAPGKRSPAQGRLHREAANPL